MGKTIDATIKLFYNEVCTMLSYGTRVKYTKVLVSVSVITEWA